MNEEGIENAYFGSGGDIFALLTLRGFRVIMGRVSEEGLKLQGKGFKSACHSDGAYSVRFKKPFKKPPIVIVNAVNQNQDLSVTLYEITTKKFELVTAEVGVVGDWSDRQLGTEFTFVALGRM